MKGFRFKLDPVLELRRREERDELVALAALERERSVLEEQLRAGQQRIDDARASRGDMLCGSVDLRRAAAQARAEAAVDVASRRVALQLAAVLRRLDLQRGVVAAAAQRRRMLERLRERRLETFRVESDRRERSMLDDLSMSRRRADGSGRV